MSLILWGVVGVLVGLLASIASPILAGPYLDTRARERVADVYYGLAMTAMDRAILIRRLNGGYTVKASEFDSEHSTETVSIGGEAHDLSDVANLMTRAYKRPFGVNYEGYDVITDARHAEVGEEHHEHCHNKDHIGENSWEPTFSLDAMTRLVDPALTKHIMPSSTEPGDRREATELTKESLADYKSKDPVDIVIIAGLYMGALGLVWFLASNGGGISSSVMSAAGTIMLGVGI
jgi:hypothetical protein